jgi:hypothetical protein
MQYHIADYAGLVARFNAEGREGLLDRKTSGTRPTEQGANKIKFIKEYFS